MGSSGIACIIACIVACIVACGIACFTRKCCSKRRCACCCSFKAHKLALQSVIERNPPAGLGEKQRTSAREAALRQNRLERRNCQHLQMAKRPHSVLHPQGFDKRRVRLCRCEELFHLTVNRKTFLMDTYNNFIAHCRYNSKQHFDIFREHAIDSGGTALRRKLIVRYEGESGIDEGGLTQDFYQQFCKSLTEYTAPPEPTLVWTKYTTRDDWRIQVGQQVRRSAFATFAPLDLRHTQRIQFSVGPAR
eukprot:SAG31_NODE_6483_length_2001_cov_1.146162_3_plen_248_part_00